MRKVYGTILAATLIGVCPASRAQFAVIDVGAITQLIQEVSTLQQQLQTAERTLTNAQQQFQAITGNRGMQNLLSGTNRNYLPTTWSQLSAAITQTGGAYQALSIGTQSLMTANAVLTQQQLNEIAAHGGKMFVRGTVRYHTLGEWHYTNFAFFWLDTQYVKASVGNESD